jgi:mannosyltransferase OCH1-like enzyme
MIPKIIHNIWIQGYDNLPNENKINYINIKKNNPDWEFMIWDDEMIKNLLKKYPKIYEIYNKINNYSGIVDNNAIKNNLASYIIMKEYGGLYFDIDFKCISQLDNLFLNENSEINENNKQTIYIANSKTNFLKYIYPFQTTKYCSCFMAMNKNHPIWEKVINKVKYASTKYEINNALDISLQEIENGNKSNYSIVLLNKVNDNYYECINKDTVCYKQDSSCWKLITPIFKYFNCFYKQTIMFLIVIIIIISVEYLYMHNAIKYGSINFIPGLQVSQISTQSSLQKKKVKRNNK